MCNRPEYNIRPEFPHHTRARHVTLRREESTRVTIIPLPLCFCAAALWAQSPAAPFDVKAMDLSADPCTDFYQYACGSWMKNNPVPADE